MKTSPFLDEIRAEGRVEEVQSLVLQLGEQKFGSAPTKSQRRVLTGLADLNELEALAKRLLNVDSWTDLLGNGEAYNASN